MQLCRFAQYCARLVQCHALHLVALFGGCQIFHHQHEFAARFIDGREICLRHADARTVRQLVIEVHLADIIAECDACLPAVFMGGGEFADKRCRCALIAVRIIQCETHTVADLAGADARGGKIAHTRHAAAVGQHRAQPVRRYAFRPDNWNGHAGGGPDRGCT